MEHVEFEVTIVTRRIDWMTGHRKEEKIAIKIDSDNLHKVQNIKVQDLCAVERDKTQRSKKPTYILYSIGHMNANGMNSLPCHILNVEPGTRRKKGYEPNDFTRMAFGLE